MYEDWDDESADDSESMGNPEDGWIEDALHWGNWQYNEKEGALAFMMERRQWIYSIPLRDLTTAPLVMEWLDHLSHKNWVNARELAPGEKAEQT